MTRDGSLGDLFRRYLPLWHWQRLEVGASGVGVPDLNGCREGVEVWIENKLSTGGKIDLTPGQAAWMSRRHRSGGRVYVAVRRQTRKVPDALYLFSGGSSVALMGGDPFERVKPLGYWKGRPSFWSWKEVEAILRGRGNWES